MRRVLLLDGFSWMPESLKKGGVEEIITINCENGDYYKHPPMFVAKAMTALRQQDFDLVIIGNYTGMGLELAKGYSNVPEWDPAKVVVVRNDEWPNRETVGYRQLGIKHFTQRADIAAWLLTHHA